MWECEGSALSQQHSPSGIKAFQIEPFRKRGKTQKYMFSLFYAYLIWN
jgi:hypothetical protein